MIVLSATAAQTIEPGQVAQFDRTVLHTGCSECHRPGTGAVRLRGNGIFDVSFSGNVGGAAGTQANLAIALGGDPLRETVMVATITAATDVFNVATSTAVQNCCGDYDRITVENVGTTPVTLGAGSALYIRRIA